ncbi:hypothetical protein ABZT17_12255 [Streptomyces sp. NPDC005648]|uniref:hypothetical protein n=1 Tax=Streptomyces sp. NPDC005648 TaxID=3157044 RepID=UPI0033AE2BC4
MNGTASATEWLVCSGIGCGTGALVLGLIKLALDTEGVGPGLTAHRSPAAPPPAALPARAPARRPRHAAPLVLAETQPIRVLHHARHAKKAA